MKTKELYNAPEMDSILLPKESVMLNDSTLDRADNGYDPGNDLGEI